MAGVATAKDYLTLDFETDSTGLNPVSGKAYPQWSLPPSFDRVFGTGNLFEVSDDAHSGEHSLKFTYEARNNFCNTCGQKTVSHKKGLNNVDFFVAQSAEDLTQERYPEKLKNPKKPQKGTYRPPGPHASPGKIIYNKSRGFSKWQITSITNDSAENDRLNLKLLQPGVGEFSSKKSVFNSKDKIAITRQCGVDGIIGKRKGKFDISRRNDCNGIITWITGIDPNIQPSGSSIFRRVYLMTDSTNPPSGHKLSYARFLRGGGRDLSREVYTFVSQKTGKNEIHLSGFGKMGGKNYYKPGTGKIDNLPDDMEFRNDVWYYLEQEYKSETYTMKSHVKKNGTVIIDSYTGNGDGEYRLWFARSGEETPVPVLEIKNLHLPPLLGGKGTHMSLWGNIGHHSDSTGSWYMDDIVISSKKIGPISRKLTSSMK